MLRAMLQRSAFGVHLHGGHTCCMHTRLAGAGCAGA
jgi:hypothetical protein